LETIEGRSIKSRLSAEVLNGIPPNNVGHFVIIILGLVWIIEIELFPGDQIDTVISLKVTDLNQRTNIVESFNIIQLNRYIKTQEDERR
jgi:hypothetical protein